MKQFFVILFFLLLPGILFAQEIAITIDDAPRKDTKLFSGAERTAKLIENLQAAGVDDVLFFVKTENIDSLSRQRLDAYITAGYHLANHTHRHFSVNRVALDTYLADIDQAHEILKTFPNFLPYYRHPFLHHGRPREVRNSVRSHIRMLGYEIGYVTVDNYEWYMDALLQKAIADSKQVDYEKLKSVYVEVLWEGIQFYDKIAREQLGRSPKHVLLLHENDITALFIGDLVRHLRSHGWRIISPQEAYTDPIATTIPDVLFNGQGRVAAIARSKGQKPRDLIHISEDEVYLDKLFAEKAVFQ